MVRSKKWMGITIKELLFQFSEQSRVVGKEIKPFV